MKPDVKALGEQTELYHYFFYVYDPFGSQRSPGRWATIAFCWFAADLLLSAVY